MLFSSLAIEKIACGDIAWIGPQHRIVDLVGLQGLIIVFWFFLRLPITGVGSVVSPNA